MLKAVVFDLDGTLIDSTEAIVDSFVATFEIVGDPVPTREFITQFISVPLEKHFAELTDRDPVELSRIYREHYFATCTEGTVLLPGVEEALLALGEAGLRLAIATSKSCKGSEILLEYLDVAHHFEFVVGADSVVNHKPHPEALEMSREQLGIESEEMIYVGDTRFDTEASKNAGIGCVAVATGYAPRSELEALAPRHVADTMQDACVYILNQVATTKDIS
ncbi:MAG: HAD family hydrolase [Candidatus Hydrogenedentota bacterium]